VKELGTKDGGRWGSLNSTDREEETKRLESRRDIKLGQKSTGEDHPVMRYVGHGTGRENRTEDWGQETNK